GARRIRASVPTPDRHALAASWPHGGSRGRDEGVERLVRGFVRGGAHERNPDRHRLRARLGGRLRPDGLRQGQQPPARRGEAREAAHRGGTAPRRREVTRGTTRAAGGWRARWAIARTPGRK